MSRPLRVCFMIDALSARAGTECQLLLLLKHLDRERIAPYLVLTKETETSAGSLVPEHCPVLFLGLKKLCSFDACRKALQFRRFLKRERIDLIQTYFPDSTFFGAVVGKLSGVPTVFGSRRNIGHWMRPRDARVAKFLNRFLIDKILANAEACRRAVIEQENAKPENVVVIPNGIETERFQNVSTWSPERANSPRRIGAVGNLKPVKGTDVLIDAAKIVLEMHPETRFEIAGTGDFEAYNQQIADRGIADRFQLLGPLEAIPEFLASLDVAVLPSRAEGLSNGLLEYMAAGRPCVATEVGGNGELIRHEQNGLLVPPENPAALAAAIRELLDDPEKAGRLAATARADVQEKYDADRIAERFSSFVEDRG